MKLRNKKTGEIVEVESCNSTAGTIGLFFYEGRECDRAYSSLAELNEEWEDYEEPETFWYMTAWGDVKEYSQDQFAIKQKRAIGNYFKAREEGAKEE